MAPVLRCTSFAAYLDRLTMPKLLINSGGDEFFLPDDNHYFWNDLPGEKFLRYKSSKSTSSSPGSLPPLPPSPPETLGNFNKCCCMCTYDIEHSRFFQYHLRDILPNIIFIPRYFHCIIIPLVYTLTLFTESP